MNPSTEKPTKKTTKRKRNSAPDLPPKDLRIKSTDMYPVSPKDIQKYQESIGVVDKKKKSKQKGKHQTKKAGSNQAEKILQKTVKPTNEKKETEEYPYLIKKNIVNMMGEKKKVVKEPKKKKAEKTSKLKANDVPIPKTVSEPVKKTKTTSPKVVKSAPHRAEVIKSSVTKKRVVSPNLKANLPQTPHYTTYFTQTKENPALLLYPQVTSFRKNSPKPTKGKINPNPLKVPKARSENAAKTLLKRTLHPFMKKQTGGPNSQKKNSPKIQAKFGDSELKMAKKPVQKKRKITNRKNLQQLTV